MVQLDSDFQEMGGSALSGLLGPRAEAESFQLNGATEIASSWAEPVRPSRKLSGFPPLKERRSTNLVLSDASCLQSLADSGSSWSIFSVQFCFPCLRNRGGSRESSCTRDGHRPTAIRAVRTDSLSFVFSDADSKKAS